MGEPVIFMPANKSDFKGTLQARRLSAFGNIITCCEDERGTMGLLDLLLIVSSEAMK